MSELDPKSVYAAYEVAKENLSLVFADLSQNDKLKLAIRCSIISGEVSEDSLEDGVYSVSFVDKSKQSQEWKIMLNDEDTINEAVKHQLEEYLEHYTDGFISGIFIFYLNLILIPIIIISFLLKDMFDISVEDAEHFKKMSSGSLFRLAGRLNIVNEMVATVRSFDGLGHILHSYDDTFEELDLTDFDIDESYIAYRTC